MMSGGFGRCYDATQAYGAQVAAQNAQSEAQESSIQSGKAKRNAERLYLITQAMWELMSPKLGLADADLEAKVREIDLRDGRLDGQDRTQIAARSCRHCGRKILAGQKVCSWCGAPDHGGVFSHEG